MDAVLFINWNSAYNSIGGMMSHLGAAWRAAGLEMVEINLGAEGWDVKLRELVQSRHVRFVLSPVGIGANIRIDQEVIWDKLKIPVYCLHGDHPVYLAKNHVTQPATFVLGYIFRDHALYQASDVGAKNLVTAIDLGIPDLPVQPMEKLLAGGRPRLLFPKTGNSPEQLAQSWRAAPQIERIIHDALDELDFARRGFAHVAAFHPLVARVAAAHRVDVQKFDLLSRYLIAQLDDYIRRLKSTAIARAILPFEVDVFGSAWEHIDTRGARARFHGPVEYSRMEAELSTATACLSSNPNVDLGAHERVFLSIGAGNMPLTDRNRFIDEAFPELREYMFDFTPGSIAAAVERVVKDPETALLSVRGMRKRAREQYGIEVTAAKILETMQSKRFLMNLPRPGQAFFVP